MIKDGFGHIINISSIWGKAAPSNRSAYSSAKFGLIALMDSIRYEVMRIYKYDVLILEIGCQWVWSNVIGCQCVWSNVICMCLVIHRGMHGHSN